MRGGGPKYLWPFRPRIVLGTAFGRAGHQLELMDQARALAVRGSQAVGTGVTASNDRDPLPASVQRILDFQERITARRFPSPERRADRGEARGEVAAAVLRR